MKKTMRPLSFLLLLAILSMTTSSCMPRFSKSKPSVSVGANRSGAAGGVSKGLFEW